MAPFDSLLQESYVSLTTFRKSGIGVATPMWFAQEDGVIYIFTGSTSGKVKRIRNTSRVTLAACTGNGKVTGSTIEATARIISDSQEMARAEATLVKKYGIQRVSSGVCCTSFAILQTYFNVSLLPVRIWQLKLKLNQVGFGWIVERVFVPRH